MFESLLYKTPTLFRYLLPQAKWKIKTEEKQIFLTFDDGPIPGLTPKILDVLADFSAEATFFCVGDNIRKHGDIFQQIVNAGHSVGNHTQNHLKAWKTNQALYLANIEQCEAYLIKHYAEREKLFRPPYGHITPSLVRELTKRGYKIIMWDVLSQDYNQALSPKVILRNILRTSEKGSIIVFHDNLKAEKSLIEILPEFLKHFSDLGFKFSKL